MAEQMFNKDQLDYMRYLASLPKSAKCDCGWAKRGECFGQCYGDKEKGGFVQQDEQGEDA